VFDSKTSQNDENSTQSSPSANQSQIASDTSKEPNQDEENNPAQNLTLLQQMGHEINSTMAGRAVSSMAKIATNKMSELLSKYPIIDI
jgi:biotin carboxyl carrier protein